jgi:hypothetical protein
MSGSVPSSGCRNALHWPHQPCPCGSGRKLKKCCGGQSISSYCLPGASGVLMTCVSSVF